MNTPTHAERLRRFTDESIAVHEQYLTDPVLLQVALPKLLAEYRPPEENVLPTRDNQTHSRAVREEMLALLGED